MFFEPTITETVLVVTSLDGDTFAFVTYTDGGYGIARNGKPVRGLYWRGDDQMDECLTHLLRLADLNPAGGPFDQDLYPGDTESSTEPGRGDEL